MAEKSYFFNDVNGDRVYLAEDFAVFFSTLIANGVFPNPSTNLQVLVNEEFPMTITIPPGNAWINGYLYWNPDNLVKTLAPAYTNPRIDRVVTRWVSNTREIRSFVVTGIPGAVPVAPELTRNSDVWELAIADILVSNGAVSITQSNITDLRLNTVFCGIVHGVVDQVDTTTIFNQYQAWYLATTTQADIDIDATMVNLQNSFNTWFATIQNVLDANTAGNLLNMINTHIADTNAHVTLAKQTAWDGNTTDIIAIQDDLNAVALSESSVFGAKMEIDLTQYASIYNIPFKNALPHMTITPNYVQLLAIGDVKILKSGFYNINVQLDISQTNNMTGVFRLIMLNVTTDTNIATEYSPVSGFATCDANLSAFDYLSVNDVIKFSVIAPNNAIQYTTKATTRVTITPMVFS